MSSSRRSSNGRSPLVNQQRQITSFFSKFTSASLSPSPSPSSVSSKQKTNPNPTPTPTPTPTSITPSPLNPKSKPLLVIGGDGGVSSPSPTPKSDRKSYGEEVIGKKIKVYWPLDKSWYEGCVKSFDKTGGKHVVKYDDGDEESLDLRSEKIEWIQETRKLKRLQPVSLDFKRTVIADDKESGNMDVEEEKETGKHEVVEDDDDGDDTDLDEKEDEENEIEKSKGKRGSKVATKRKVSAVEKFESSKKSKINMYASDGIFKESGQESSKKSKTNMDANNGVFKESGKESSNPFQEKKATNRMDNVMTSDAAERFSLRESQKLYFLGENRRDARRRRPGEGNYDPRTLYLPHDFLKSLSDGQKQWWEFKSKHMDKVLFFKMGKFYELFEMDAHIGVKELDLQYMKGEQPHCGFPERNFSMNVEKLATKGYRVLVVEQTETPEQLELRRKETGSKDKVVKREICAVVTKGTLTEGELLSANPEALYLMAITESDQGLNNSGDRLFGVCVVDAATSRIILGQFTDDSECSALSCILSEMRPVEIVKPMMMLSAETERVLVQHTRNPLVNELIPLEEFWDAEKTIHEIKRIYNCNVEEDGSNNLPKVLMELVNAKENGSNAISALGGALFYLKQAFLDETLFRFAKFELLPCSDFKDFASKPYLILDAAALENLEIFENTRNGDSSGTLYAQLNYCVTAFGKRLLKAWLARPLYHLESIRERQEAVAGLRGDNVPYALEFRKSLSRLPDMERLLARIFSSSEASGRNSNKVILYEDAAKKQLQEFIAALRGCETMAQACSSLSVILENVDSKQLHQILTAGTGIHGIQSVLNKFKDAFDWEKANSNGRIIPHGGVDVDYDSACKIIKEIESSLSKYLKEQRKLLGDSSITYVAIGKEAYLLEVPERLQEFIPRNYELRSSRKGFFRYWTPDIKRLLSELSQAESEKESSLKNILQRLIRRFCEHHFEWRQLSSATAELDVLISLAIASDYYEGPTCRPSFSESSRKDEVPSLIAKSLGHPVLRSDSLGKGTFVPNDLAIGGPSNPSFILLTGPNMGGKSTLLRQVCLAVVLAQVGADVPAESFEVSLVDRIFVRMGAKDNIMAGQSTFLTELSETAAMLHSATSNSLVALDELGRGTSTSDGQAIAESVLEHFLKVVHCRGMFSTHYHRLSIHYEKSPEVSLCHMACRVSDTVGGVEEVTFLYRLTDGACPKSYGVNVARLAGLPNFLLHRAAAKSREFEASCGNDKQGNGANSSSRLSLNKMVKILQKIIDTAPSITSNKNIDHFFSLSEIQREARILLQ